MLNNMGIKKYILLCLLFLFTINIAKAQNNKMYENLNKLITFDVHFLETNPNYLNKSFMFFIAISVNKNGVVDTVIYNAKNHGYEKDPIYVLLDFEKIAKTIKSNKKDFLLNKNEVLVLLTYLRNGHDDDIKNANDLDFTWRNLHKELYKFRDKKKLIFLEPNVINYSWKIIR